MRDRMQRFMEGRYGQDQLSRFLSIFALILLVISMFVSRAWVLFYIAVILIIYADFRVMSRNIAKRGAENDRFMELTDRLSSRFGGRQGNRGSGRASRSRSRASRAQDRSYQKEQKKIYKYFKCPKCGQKVRVPKGHGKICITCPKCRVEFVRKS